MSNHVVIVLQCCAWFYVSGATIAGIYACNHGGYNPSQVIAFILFWPLWFCRSQIIAFKQVWKQLQDEWWNDNGRFA